MTEPKFPPMTTFTPLDPLASATAQLRAQMDVRGVAADAMRERDQLRERVTELEHFVVGLRGIVENWREAVHSDYGAMAAVDDHLGRLPSPSERDPK